jgi:hypothetical protein
MDYVEVEATDLGVGAAVVYQHNVHSHIRSVERHRACRLEASGVHVTVDDE